jgi:hypothetical protein
MRKEGTKYPTVKSYDKRMQPVSAYAANKGTSVAQVYIQYDRHATGYKSGYKGPHPGYIIRQFNGMNYVIPD